MPIKQHIEREQEAFEKRLYIPEGWHPELPKDTLYGEEHYPESAYELSEEKIQDILAFFLTRIPDIVKELVGEDLEKEQRESEPDGELKEYLMGKHNARQEIITRLNEWGK